MDWMSPRELNDDPTRWLNIPHELHESLLSLQEKLFPGFTEKLKATNVHCFQCENMNDFDVILGDTMELQICTGYIGKVEEPDTVMLHCKKPEKEED